MAKRARVAADTPAVDSMPASPNAPGGGTPAKPIYYLFGGDQVGSNMGHGPVAKSTWSSKASWKRINTHHLREHTFLRKACTCESKAIVQTSCVRFLFIFHARTACAPAVLLHARHTPTIL
jgi:hypothetical protein